MASVYWLISCPAWEMETVSDCWGGVESSILSFAEAERASLEREGSVGPDVGPHPAEETAKLVSEKQKLQEDVDNKEKSLMEVSAALAEARAGLAELGDIVQESENMKGEYEKIIIDNKHHVLFYHKPTNK